MKGRYMYITRKGQYALFLMIALAIEEGKTVTIKQVAGKYDLSEKFMEQVATKLKNSGMIKVIRGSHGGYFLAKDSRNYTVREIVSAVDGEKYTVDIDSDQVNESNLTMSSIVSELGHEVDSAVDKVLSGQSLHDLVKAYLEHDMFSYVI